jgi:hypothetical protein
MSAAYVHYSISVFLCFVRLDFVDFDSNGTRAHATRRYPDRWHIAYGFGFPERTFVFFTDTDSFADSVATHGRAFQKSEGAIDWTGRDGRARGRYRD